MALVFPSSGQSDKQSGGAAQETEGKPNSNRQKSWGWLLTGVGGVVVGAIGSGVWDSALQPGLGWLGRAALTVGTLGLERYKDGLYQQVAQPNNEQVSSFLVSLTMFFLAGLVGFVHGRVRGARQVQEESAPGTLQSLEIRKRNLRIGVILLAAGAAWIAVSFVRTTYVNRAQVYYSQLYEITAIQMTPEQRLESRSQFAQVQSRHDFVRVTGMLVEVAEQHGFRVPEFEVW